MSPLSEDYRLLEVTTSATPAEIKQAYLQLLQVWHPDRFQHSPHLRSRAEEKTKAINAAFARVKHAPLWQPTPPLSRKNSARQPQRLLRLRTSRAQPPPQSNPRVLRQPRGRCTCSKSSQCFPVVRRARWLSSWGYLSLRSRAAQSLAACSG
jgi:hypothetical protein